MANTTEANAGIDLVHLAKCLTSNGTLNRAYVGEHFNDTPGWSTLAAEVLRLTALVADLTAANAALAADNARLVTPQAAARVLLMLEVIDDIETACRDYRVQSPQFRAVMGAIARGAA